ncbi:DUF3016 domain-containing protein [Pelagicoccus sp. SDUM812003]|uniref:DUF3016 domain-containing protein n=1 Tax=Pelagicoccus sp. SDUM812003 TaxID=3041267 RepID=UPI00280F2DD1|nr:DUF3016 domain-containing protein [Pelagicoccus sp. SDUM812003]MDQ8205620.1 DUF3016 domain-containing protein [Pelagicoccus sp. SDUM812003]
MNPITKNILAAGAALAMVAPLSAGTSAIEWEKPDSYTDIGSDYGATDQFDLFKKEIESYVERVAETELPDGAILEMKVSNVDLAGQIEPWGLNQDVRIVRDIYPPKMRFTYTLRKDGKVVSEGKENLSDLDFTYNIGRRFFDQDQFFYEKEMIGEWIRSEFKNS